MNDVRPLHLLGRHACASLEARVSSALDLWAAAWLSRPAASWPVHAEPASALPANTDPTDHTERVGATGRLWLRRSPEQADALAHAVLGDGFRPSAGLGDAWSEELLSAAQAQLDDALAQSLIGPVQASMPRAPEAALFRFGSGAVHIACPLVGVDLVADSGVLRHVPPRPPQAGSAHRPAPSTLAPWRQAAGNSRLSVAVSLGEVELELAHLLALQPGDVLRLPTRLSDRLAVTVEGRACALGSIGHLGAFKAVQLVSP